MDERETPTIEWIKHNLDRLISLDQQYWVSGAKEHQYKSYPLSNDEIESLESKLGIRLPEDYRQFLLEIGYGAGPSYGLLSPSEILRNLLEEDYSGKDPTWPPKPSQPFPMSLEQAQAQGWWMMSEGHRTAVEMYWPTNGCIPICSEYDPWYYLVTSGELAGSVVYRYAGVGDPLVADLNRWTPPQKPLHIRWQQRYQEETIWPSLSGLPTFMAWYCAWLDQCLSDFEELKRNKSWAEKIVDKLWRKS
jgi:hypothetical protein